MNYKELYNTDEDLKNFVEEMKQGLINKNNELLEKLKNSTSETTGLTEKCNALTEKVNCYEDEIKNNFINNSFSKSDKKLIEGTESLVKDLLMKNNNFDLKINDDKKVTYTNEDGKSFEDVYSDFLSTDTAKNFILNSSCGGGAIGGSNNTMTLDTIKNMTTEQLANQMKNESFRQSLDSLLSKNY